MDDLISEPEKLYNSCRTKCGDYLGLRLPVVFHDTSTQITLCSIEQYVLSIGRHVLMSLGCVDQQEVSGLVLGG
jgi:hypothetical protein